MMTYLGFKKGTKLLGHWVLPFLRVPLGNVKSTLSSLSGMVLFGEDLWHPKRAEEYGTAIEADV